MLVRFAVKNFLSFRDKTEFNMLTGEVRRHKNHVKKVGDVEILRAAAIYGANASGKSNLFNVMLHLTQIVLQKTSLNKASDLRFLLDKSTIDKEQEFSTTKIARQIGNAVPVKLGQVIAKSIKAHLERLTYE